MWMEESILCLSLFGLVVPRLTRRFSMFWPIQSCLDRRGTSTRQRFRLQVVGFALVSVSGLNDTKAFCENKLFSTLDLRSLPATLGTPRWRTSLFLLSLVLPRVSRSDSRVTTPCGWNTNSLRMVDLVTITRVRRSVVDKFDVLRSGEFLGDPGYSCDQTSTGTSFEVICRNVCKWPKQGVAALLLAWRCTAILQPGPGETYSDASYWHSALQVGLSRSVTSGKTRLCRIGSRSASLKI